MGYSRALIYLLLIRNGLSRFHSVATIVIGNWGLMNEGERGREISVWKWRRRLYNIIDNSTNVSHYLSFLLCFMTAMSFALALALRFMFCK